MMKTVGSLMTKSICQTDRSRASRRAGANTCWSRTMMGTSQSRKSLGKASGRGPAQTGAEATPRRGEGMSTTTLDQAVTRTNSQSQSHPPRSTEGTPSKPGQTRHVTQVITTGRKTLTEPRGSDPPWELRHEARDHLRREDHTQGLIQG